jgi:hypothetical protein
VGEKNQVCEDAEKKYEKNGKKSLSLSINIKEKSLIFIIYFVLSALKFPCLFYLSAIFSCVLYTFCFHFGVTSKKKTGLEIVGKKSVTSIVVNIMGEKNFADIETILCFMLAN